MLTLDALRVRHGPLEALHGVSLTVEAVGATSTPRSHTRRGGAPAPARARTTLGSLRPHPLRARVDAPAPTSPAPCLSRPLGS